VSGSSDGAGNQALFNQPNGIAIGNGSTLYVADTGNSTIRAISAAGVVTTLAGLPGIAGHKDGSGIDAWFNQPRDLTLSINGSLYVADTGNAAIRRIETNGIVTTLPLVAASSVTPSPTVPLPNSPSLPNPLPTPTLPATPTPPSSATSGGGGGGGAPSLWFCLIVASLYLGRRATRRS
jgi:hypothetical protein